MDKEEPKFDGMTLDQVKTFIFRNPELVSFECYHALAQYMFVQLESNEAEIFTVSEMVRDRDEVIERVSDRCTKLISANANLMQEIATLKCEIGVLNNALHPKDPVEKLVKDHQESRNNTALWGEIKDRVKELETK